MESLNPYQPPAEVTEARVVSGEVSTARWLVVMFMCMVTPGLVLLVASLLA